MSLSGSAPRPTSDTSTYQIPSPPAMLGGIKEKVLKRAQEIYSSLTASFCEEDKKGQPNDALTYVVSAPKKEFDHPAAIEMAMKAFGPDWTAKRVADKDNLYCVELRPTQKVSVLAYLLGEDASSGGIADY